MIKMYEDSVKMRTIQREVEVEEEGMDLEGEDEKKMVEEKRSLYPVDQIV